MPSNSSRRSVLPNSARIDELRIRRGLTLESLAETAEVGMRTLQKAVAGERVSVDTLSRVAATLGAKFEELVIIEKPGAGDAASNGESRLLLDLALPGHISVTGDNAELLAHQFIQRFAESLIRHASVPSVSTTSESIPTTIRYAGQETQTDYMQWYRLRYIGTASDNMKPWDELPELERLRHCIALAGTHLGGLQDHYPIDWVAMRPYATIDPKLLTPEEQYHFAEQALELLDRWRNEYPNEHVDCDCYHNAQLNFGHLREQSHIQHQIDQMKKLLQKAVSGD